MNNNFPDDFLWGAATAAFQVEGHLLADGAGESSWLNFCREPGRIENDDIPLIGASQYTLYKEDIALMKELGIKAYRFSLGWSRIFPDGTGRVNPGGVDYYNRLIDELLQNGIQPWPTVFHWDLPQKLEDNGGWRNKDTAYALGEYAGFVAQTFSDRVKNFFTVNEIICFTRAGYGDGVFAPGLKLDTKSVNQTIHNGCLAHGLAMQAMRAVTGNNVRLGLVDNCTSTVPVYETPENIAAAAKAFRIVNAQISTLINEGRYIDEFIAEQKGNMPEYSDDELKIISTPTDFNGLNLYAPYHVIADESKPRGYREVIKPEGYPRMNMSWLHIGPEIIYYAAKHVQQHWKSKAIYITENGCAAIDKKSHDGEVYDSDRIFYLRGHLQAAKRAVDEGIPLKGYFVWSLLDNFEWASGFQKRFGIVYVNYNDLKRTPKLSAKYYRAVINANQVL
jgi:beta-glucosidase